MMGSKMKEAIMEQNIGNVSQIDSTAVIKASAAKDAVAFRNAKKQVLVESAMKTMQNPLFTYEMDKDIA